MKCSEDIKKCKFRIGIGLIFASYVAWASTLVIGGLAIKNNTRILYFVTISIYVLNWLFFGVGLFLAGKEGFRYSKNLLKKVRSFFTSGSKNSKTGGLEQ